MNIKIINTKEKSRDNILKKLCAQALKDNIISDEIKVFDAFLKREEQGTTGFTRGIAIPHAKIKEILQTTIFIARNNEGVDWPSIDEKPTSIAIALLVEGGQSANDDHLKLLANVASSLIEDKNKKIYATGSIDEIKAILKK